jgi:hypothetical protein
MTVVEFRIHGGLGMCCILIVNRLQQSGSVRYHELLFLGRVEFSFYLKNPFTV